ncbi:hypothetical protein PHLCEN_2v3323 [Hermanssonia centrifuga]|uniref:Uncharacterized protein n=1 Tax=Hermanssonia centrifuga TaxID=98765 RepID=A0A2R6QM71_9APHY|nr:hypothetical protein PHLCEN_2v3323 [Hermanssonia centrifuga]
MLRKQSSHANSSPQSSASSHEDVYSERFFEPEYPPNDIKTWRSSMKSMHAEVPVYYAHATDLSPQGFFVDSSTLYAPHNILGVTPTPSSAIPRTSPVDLSGRKSSKHDLQTADTLSTSPMGYDIESPPTKRTRKGSSQNPRISGACTRCKRLKAGFSHSI